MAKFKINYLFTITGRGTALIGEIIEGEIGPGHNFQLIINGHPSILRVKSVEGVRSKNMAEVALVVKSPQGVSKDELLPFIGQTIAISAD